LKLAVAAAGVAVATALTFWPVLGAKASLFDDFEYVIQNPLVQNPGWQSVKLFFSEVTLPSTVAGYYQPLSMTSLMLDYAIGHGDYRTYHRTSLALHIGCTVLTIVLVDLLFANLWASVAAGLLFGLHPGTVESVAWVADRKTALATFFALASLIAYVRHTRTTRVFGSNYWTCFLLFGLALLSKPTVTMLPLLMLLLDIWPLRRWSWRALIEKLPLFVLAGASAAITSISQSSSGGVVNPNSYPIWGMPLLLSHNIIFYLQKIFWPVGLSAYYPWPTPFSLSRPAVQVGLIGTIALLAVLILSLRWTRSLMISWLFFFVAILPAMGIIGFTTSIAADRFSYLPKIGLLMGLTYWIKRASESSGPRRSFVAAAILCACAAEAGLTREYLQQWKDSESLLRYLVARSPQSAYLHGNLGNVLQGEGKIDGARSEYLEALRLGEDPGAHEGLGGILLSEGRIKDAEPHLREAYRLLPNDIGNAMNHAIVLDRLHQFAESSKLFEVIIRQRPHMASAFYNYGLSLFRRSKFDEAERRFLQALEMEPDHAGAHYQLGCLLASEGKIREALDQWRLAAKADPRDPQTLVTLAWVLGTADDAALRSGEEAVLWAGKADGLKAGQDPSVLDTLAAAYAEAGRFDEAVSAAKASIERWKAMGQPDAAREVEARLQSFKTGRPYHEAVRKESYLAQ
jgi:protein O-mannosyl-transferase